MADAKNNSTAEQRAQKKAARRAAFIQEVAVAIAVAIWESEPIVKARLEAAQQAARDLANPRAAALRKIGPLHVKAHPDLYPHRYSAAADTQRRENDDIVLAWGVEQGLISALPE